MRITIDYQDDTTQFFELIKKIKESSKDGLSFFVAINHDDGELIEKFKIAGGEEFEIKKLKLEM